MVQTVQTIVTSMTCTKMIHSKTTGIGEKYEEGKFELIRTKNCTKTLFTFKVKNSKVVRGILLDGTQYILYGARRLKIGGVWKHYTHGDKYIIFVILMYKGPTNKVKALHVNLDHLDFRSIPKKEKVIKKFKKHGKC